MDGQPFLTIKKKDKNKNIKKQYVEDQYVEHLLNVLTRYAISQGYSVKKVTFKNLYRIFRKELNIKVNGQDKFDWLLRIARILERNQHKPFDLKEFIK